MLIFIGSNIYISNIDAAKTLNPPSRNTLVLNQSDTGQEQAEAIGKGTLFLSTIGVRDLLGDIDDEDNNRVLIVIDAVVGQADPPLITIEEGDTDISHEPIFIYPGSYTIKVKEVLDPNNDSVEDINVEFSGDCPVGTIDQIGDENNCIINSEEIGYVDAGGELIGDTTVEEVDDFLIDPLPSTFLGSIDFVNNITLNQVNKMKDPPERCFIILITPTETVTKINKTNTSINLNEILCSSLVFGYR